MGKATVKLTADIRKSLEQAVIQGEWMRFPVQLANYAKVKKFLEHIGSLWFRKEGAHSWGPSQQARYQQLLEEGGFVDKKVLHQQFFTPRDVARRIVEDELEDFVPRSGQHVRMMDPSCGDGSFLEPLYDWSDKQAARHHYADEYMSQIAVVGVELDEALVSARTDRRGFVLCADFLTLQPKTTALCDRIFMNPPFTGGQDIRHVMHAFQFLKPQGKLYAIVAGNTGKGSSSLERTFGAFMETYCFNIEELRAGTFKQSGTMVHTQLLTFIHPDY